jgi:transcriptional regulator with XRE-family HTH domain
LQDVFVNEASSQPEVVAAWKNEQERRNKINERTGLKAMGAGFRLLRSQKNLTLAEVAKNADMTLSVYHRIEMGQREVSDLEFANISRALDIAQEDLRRKIENLEKEGSLQDIIQKNDSRYKPGSIRGASFSEVMNLSSKKIKGDEAKMDVYGKASQNGDIIVNKDDPIGETNRPMALLNNGEAYAINLCSRRLGNLLPTRSTLFVDPKQMASLGDLALYYVEEQTAKIISLREDESGNLYGLQWNPEEKIVIDEINASMKLHKIVLISLY